MRRALAVAAGVVTANAIYGAVAFGMLAPIQRASGDSPESWLGVVFLGVMPLAQLLGGLLTGYLARAIPAPKLPFAVLHSSGLWTLLPILPTLGGTTRGFQVFMLIAGATWIASSTAGVFLGARWFRRRRIATT